MLFLLSFSSLLVHLLVQLIAYLFVNLLTDLFPFCLSHRIANRIRQVLYDFALAIDDNGKLIVKQNKPPTSQMNMMYTRKPHHY